MKKTDDSQRKSPLVWSCISMCVGFMGYIIFKQSLFLVVGLLGFTLIFILKK